MSRQPYTVPICLLDSAKLLFPTLNFGRIHFYREEAITQVAYTLTFLTRTEITFRSPLDPCDPELGYNSFKILCHELVHALQMESLLNRIVRRAAAWTCGIFHGRDSESSRNCIEREAWAYEDQLDLWLKSQGLGPCSCSWAPVPEREFSASLGLPNPGFAEAVSRDPSIVKRSAGNCTPWDCIGPGFWSTIIGAVVSTGSLIWAVPTAVVEGTAGTIGSIIGAVAGVGGGLVAGTILLPSIIGAVLGGLIGLIAGATLGALIGNIVHWVAGLFGDDGGSLNLMFSTDEGLSFGSKVTFERSTEPFSLSFGFKRVGNRTVDRLAVAFTGTDNRINILTLPYTYRWQSVATFQEGEDCGPAIAHYGGRMHIAWQGADNHLNTVTTYDGHALALQRTLQSTSLNDASPALCLVGGKLILAFIDRALHIRLRVSDDGVVWRPSVVLGERADSQSTPAITPTRGNGFALAWVGAERHKRVNVKQLTVHQTTGAITEGAKVTLLGERSNAGPAVCFYEPFLYVAWTGTDGRVNVMRSREFPVFTDKRTFERSRDDCGPALCVVTHTDASGAEKAAICIGWTGING